MKHLNKLCVVALIFMGFNNLQAQGEDNPWQISVGINALDFFPTNDPDNANSGKWFDQYFNVDEHWNILPAVSYLGVSRYVGSGFSIGVRGSLNQIDQVGDASINEIDQYAVDGTIRYNFIRNKVLDPFFEFGSGYIWADNLNDVTLNGGIGFNVWFTKTLGLSLQSQYKHVVGGGDIPEHFQHLAGFNFRFGGTDSDGDGIYDKNDDCPEVAGDKEFNGCPDSDGDGTEDTKDACPNEAGPKELNGCPDTDGDGIIDEKDACPNEAGSIELKGCPDTDSDGVSDKDDACPNEAGPIENNGCPWADTDGDGVLDKDDLCPETTGTVANKGCPEVTTAVQKQLNVYAKTILFDTGKATIKPESTSTLVDIIQILNEYPNAKFTVEGHTDSVGRESTNQRLSESRALSVKEFLVDKGVEAFRLSAVGYGETRPIATNTTVTGKAQNRRVEINLVK